ncbi:DENN domain-containing protein 4C, partial [Fragariocoptes setiger]
MDDKRIADYFVIAGVSRNPEFNTESKQILSPLAPITDITVIFKSLGETVPEGYECLEKTVTGYPADLNHGNLRSSNIYICYRRGNDKPPLVDIGVLHEGKERLRNDSEIVTKTPYGHCASTGNSSKHGTYLTYRRAKSLNSCNQLVVVELCITLNNKNEAPPHAFYAIRSNLNSSVYAIGSEVFLCYKKSLVRPPSLCYTPQILSRFPLQDYAKFALPESVPLFCLPTGATIELWPLNTVQPKPAFSTFVLTSGLAQKVYGSSISFYERYDESHLSQDQKQRLGLTPGRSSSHRIYAIKSCSILSRWPFFDSFEKFLLFLHRMVFHPPSRNGLFSAISYSNQNNPPMSPKSQTHSHPVPIEHYISHFLLDVPFPTSQRPKIQVQLTNDEHVVISQPFNSLPLPSTGASFVQLLRTIGSENCLNLLLFGLSEQKILLHSLRPHALTGAAEAITAMLFPFHWQCPYVPLCPLSLCGVLNAPLPFIVGIDSSCFDLNTPPPDVVCVDLDTKHILLSEYKKCLNLKLLPKRPSRILRATLDRIQQRLSRLPTCYQTSLNGHSPVHGGSPSADGGRVQYERQLELEIREAFVRFMATILRDFRSYLLPITKAPTIGTTDPSSLFNLDGFLKSRDRNYSQFYQLITKTQMFTHYIEERSFVSDKDTSLAFFDDCEERLAASENIFSDRPIRLFDTDELLSQADRYIFIPAPEYSPLSVQENPDDNEARLQHAEFGPLNSSLFHRHPNLADYADLPSLNGFETLNHLAGQLGRHNDNAQRTASIPDFQGTGKTVSGSLARQTKQEIRAAQKRARKHAQSPILWSKYLVSCCYSLWFSHLPAFIIHSRQINLDNNPDLEEKITSEILHYAYDVLFRMQDSQLDVVEEICYRIVILLCGMNGQPALAVRVLCEMQKSGIIPNAVTYGYYNKAVLESRWPEPVNSHTTVMWNKIRNVIKAIAQFRHHGRIRRDRQEKLRLSSEDIAAQKDNTRSHDPLLAKLYCLPESQSYRPTTVPVNPAVVKSSLRDEVPNRGRRKNRSSVHHSFSIANNHNRPVEDDDVAPTLMHKSFSMHIKVSSDLDGQYDSVGDHIISVEDKPLQATHGEMTNPLRSITQEEPEPSKNPDFKIPTEHRIFRDIDVPLAQLIDHIDSEAGILFSGSDLNLGRDINNTEIIYSLQQDSQLEDLADADVLYGAELSSNDRPGAHNRLSYPSSINNSVFSMQAPTIQPTSDTVITDLKICLETQSFASDTKILLKLKDSEATKSSSSAIITKSGELEGVAQCVRYDDANLTTSPETYRNESQSSDISATADERDENDPFIEARTPTIGSKQASGHGSTDGLKLTSTPNFKLSTLLQQNSMNWASKWTPSNQSTKSVYKNIKDAASGFVSSLNEFKSSFSVSNANTPSKLLGSAQIRSTATKEMLTKCANYITDFAGPFIPQKYDHDEDEGSSSSWDDMRRFCFSLDDEYSFVNPRLTVNNNPRNSDREMMFDLFERVYSIESNELPNKLREIAGFNTESRKRIAMQIDMVSCCKCNVCKSLLYDEEIMDRWSSNDSNLNTSCAYCQAKIVPLMTISIRDLRFSQANQDSIRDNYNSQMLVDVEETVDEPMNSAGESTRVEIMADLDQSCSIRRHSEIRHSFTVPYLSPLVLRKEVGNVLESTGDGCLAENKFVDEHPIIYWNLLWFFCRVNLPTHLGELCLSANSILNGRQIPNDWTDGGQVSVSCLWDNAKLFGNMGRPLHQLWQRDSPSRNVDSILSDQMRFSKPFLERVLRALKANNIDSCLKMLLNERLKCRLSFKVDSNHHNLYREILFLIYVSEGNKKLGSVRLEREYKRAFEALNHKQVALNRFDQPPTLGSVCCRRYFKPLKLSHRSQQCI